MVDDVCSLIYYGRAEMRRAGPVRRAPRRFATRWPCRMPLPKQEPNLVRREQDETGNPGGPSVLKVLFLNPLRFSHQTRFRLWQKIHQHSKNPELALPFRRALALLGIETWETAAFSVSWLCTLSFCSLSITISFETDPEPIFGSWFRSKLSRRSCKRVESQSSSSKLTWGTILTTFFLGEMARWHDASRVRPEK